MSFNKESIANRAENLYRQMAAFERRKAIEPELNKLVEKGDITLSQKSAFSDIFAAMSDNFESCFSDYGSKAVYEFLWYFLNNCKSDTASFAAAPKKKNCSKGVSCGNTCISGSKICRKPLTPIQKEEVKEVLAVAPVPAKVKPAKTVPIKAIAPKPKTLDPKIAKPIEEISSALKEFGLGIRAIELGSSYNTQSTIRKARSVLAGSQAQGNELGIVAADKKKNLAAARLAVSLDINRGVALNNVSLADPDKQIRKLNAIASTMKDGDTIQFVGKKGHPVAAQLGLAEYTNPDANAKNPQVVYTGIVKDGKLAGIDSRSNNVLQIRRLRQDAFDYGLNAAQAVSRMPYVQDEKMKSTLPSYIKTSEDKEDREFAKIDKAENEFLGRKPGKVGDFKSYEAKAQKWSKAKFGEFNTGANGFTLEQTKAHDVAHPVTHELTGMNSDKIHAHFGNMSDVNGSKTLHAEEAVVNAMEQMSRGASLEQAILNGVRLARVTTRSDATPNKEHMAYVRSSEFVEKLSELVHKAYRNDNFAPLMAHIRKSNRISGTVQSAGDNFSGTASGG